VLESVDPEAGPGATLRTLLVWDWHGCGFNLRWRSKPGQYSDLSLAPSVGRSDHQLLVRQGGNGD
jgi:hypothetical protein